MNRKQRRASGRKSDHASGQKKDGGSRQTVARGKTPAPQGAAAAALLAATLKSADGMLARREWAAATGLYRDILRQAPDTPAALYNLGLLLAGFYSDADGVLPEELAEATRCFERYLRIKPDDRDATATLGFMRIGQGRLDDARRLMDTAAADETTSAPTLSRLGHYYRQLADPAAAERVFRAVIAKAPAMGSAWYGLSGMPCGIGGAAELAQLKSLWQQDAFRQGLSTTIDNHVFAGFGLAKATLDSGDTEAAYKYYAEANAAKRASYRNFDIVKFERRVDALIEAFNPDAIRGFKDIDAEAGRGHVFIIGMMRSGSTLVEQILASHPKVKGLGEVGYLSRVVTDMKPSVAFIPREMAAVAQGYAALMARAGVRRRADEVVTDKMLFNYLHAGWLRLAMPAAKIIHCTRDPRDTCLSIWQLPFAGSTPWAYDQVELGRYYKGYQRLMAHWDKVFPGAMYEANYERMLADQQGESRRLLEHCGLSWDDRVLEFHKTERAIQTASHTQVRQPLYQSARGKWRKAAAYIGPLLETLGLPDDA